MTLGTWCHFRIGALAPMLALLVLGCGDDDGARDAGLADAAVDASPDAAADAGPTVATSVFDPAADLTVPAAFYDLPFPLDTRLRDGRPDLRGWPHAPESEAAPAIRDLAADRRGFGALGAVYFRFDAPTGIDLRDARAPTPADPLLLVDVDPASPERGRLYPLVAGDIPPDAYAPPHLLALAPLPGVVLPPGRAHAFVVRRGAADLAPAPAFEALGAGPLADTYAPLWETLATLGVPREDVVVASIVTAHDVVAETAALADRVAAERGAAGHAPELQGLALDPDDGAAHARFCELHATLEVPRFQRGEPPYDTGGLFAFDAEGAPIPQTTDSIPVVLTVPRAPMPEGGFPLALYVHGSGGLSGQVVDRGPVSDRGGERAKGLGPAHELALSGIAAAGSAMPVNPERLPGADDRAYLNFENLPAYRDTFRQGVLELRLLLDAIERLALDPEALEGCAGPTLPEGTSAFTFRPRVGMGQSMGAQYIVLFAAIDPRIEALAPTGSGGYFALLSEALGLAPVVGSLLGTRRRPGLLHPGLQLTQLAWEPAEPFVSMPRLTTRPLPGHPRRPLYAPLGENDSFFPEPVFDAAAVAYGAQQVGEEVWPETQRWLAAAGLGGVASYPVRANRAGVSSAVAQFEPDGLVDAHHVFMQRPEVRRQWRCFFETHLAGDATLVAPVPDADLACE